MSKDGPAEPSGEPQPPAPASGLAEQAPFADQTWQEASGVAAHLIVLFVTVIMTGALVIQLIEPAYPCPLCLQQRMCLFLAAMGPALLIVRSHQRRYADRVRMASSMYGMTLLACVLGLLVGGRQLILHGSGVSPYVAPLFGLKLPDWGIVVSLCLIFVAGIHLLFVDKLVPVKPPRRTHIMSHLLVWFFGLLVLANIVLTFGLSGFDWFVPEDAQGYRLFHTPLEESVQAQSGTPALRSGIMVFLFIGIGLLIVYWGISAWALFSGRHRREKARRRAVHAFILAGIGAVATVLLGFGVELIMAGTGMIEVGPRGDGTQNTAEQVFSGAAWWFALGGFVLLVLPTLAIGFHLLRVHKNHRASLVSGAPPKSQ